ncbi:hypothetical protein APHAL10511_002041 [Amanita phalloides]|nr:hypothetical protein APHAL10511_002041 [Amanita phalloides]
MADGEDRPFQKDLGAHPPKTEDAAIPTRAASTKPANKPFLAYKAYREKQEALRAAWQEKKKERDEKIMRGDKVGPLEPDPTAQKQVGPLGLLKAVLYLAIFIALAGKFITGSFTWEYQSKWLQVKTYWPTGQRLFSERLLSEYDGKTPGKPIYIAIDGDVYDVTGGKAYQPGGPYHFFAGVDAARAFGTGCFKEHLTYDIRGMSKREMESVEHWKQFYAEHPKYFKVGKVLHKPIDPASVIPEHCDPKKKAENVKANKVDSSRPAGDGQTKHQEL